MDDLEEQLTTLSVAEEPPTDLARRTRARMMRAEAPHPDEPDCRAQRARRATPPLGRLPDLILCGPCPVRLLAVTIHRAPAVTGCPFAEAIPT